MRSGDDDPDACRLHREVYDMLERHIMGITASQFVWQEHGENEVEEDPAPSGEHGPSSGEADDDTLVEWGEQMQGEICHLRSSWMLIPRLPTRGKSLTHNLCRVDMMRLTEPH